MLLHLVDILPPDPQADPVTRTFRVRLSLIDQPEAMRLGATVTGRLQLEGGKGISIPASALTSIDRQPAVWIVDPASLTVSLRNVEVQRFDPATAVISQGLEPGDVVAQQARRGPVAGHQRQGVAGQERLQRGGDHVAGVVRAEHER